MIFLITFTASLVFRTIEKKWGEAWSLPCFKGPLYCYQELIIKGNYLIKLIVVKMETIFEKMIFI